MNRGGYQRGQPQGQKRGRGREGGKEYLVVFSDLANELAEGLVNVDALLGGRFDESAPEVFGEVAALCSIQDSAFVHQRDDS
jgi:hypothetical protein